MAFSEQDRSLIRKYLGFSAIFLQADPRLESAITAIQSQSDGGNRPDSNEENAVKALIYGSIAQTGAAAGVTLGPAAQNVQFAMPASFGLLQVEAQLSQMWGFTYAAGKQDEASVDTFRAMRQLRSEGRRLVHAMAKILATLPRADVFSPGETNPGGDTFYNLPDGTGSGYQW